VVDGPFILGISIDKYTIYGFDCDTDKQFTWNIKDKLVKDETPKHFLISSPFGEYFEYKLYVFCTA
jgi:hypothetical protein